MCSVGRGCFQLCLLIELVGADIDNLGNTAVLLVLSTICFARIKSDCFRDNGSRILIIRT